MNYQDTKQTKWNASALTVERINDILRELIRTVTERYITENVVYNWRHNTSYLNRLYQELRPKMEGKDQNLNDKILFALQQNCDEAVKLYKKGMPVPNEFIEDLDRWEFVLRDFAEKKGILMPDQRDILESF